MTTVDLGLSQAKTSAAPNSPTASPLQRHHPQLLDVWSRSGSKYRIRAIVLLSVNVLLFAGVGVFAFWIRSGEILAPNMDGYWDQFGLTFQFLGPRGISLGSLLLEPISVQDVPMQIPILGLLMAALIAIPILVSILYRFWASLPFIAVVGFLAVMPWLAVTLLGSCLIASVRPFRSTFRFMSALLGLAPAVVYLFLASAGTAEAVAGKIDPVDNIKFIAPWVLAIVASTVLFALVLTIAKAVDYRPGAITPLLAVMFGLPVALFERHVGRDELYYRLLESPADAHLEEVDASADLQQAAQLAWDRHPLPRPPFESVRRIEAEKWQLALLRDLAPFEAELARRQAEIAQRCDWFHEHFPTSRYALNALYIKAKALDSRIDAGEFRRTRWVRFYDDYPCVASRKVWRMIVENGPNSILSAVAWLRLAQLDARDGDVDRAAGKLGAILAGFDSPYVSEAAPPAHDASPLQKVLFPEAPQAGLHISLERVLLEAHRLYELITSNRDPVYQDDPLTGPNRPTNWPNFGLLDLNPRDERYAENLMWLKARYPGSRIEDNIDLELAKASATPLTRISRFEEVVRKFPAGDGAAEAHVRLAIIYQAEGQLEKSRAALARVVAGHHQSVWARRAARFISEPPPL